MTDNQQQPFTEHPLVAGRAGLGAQRYLELFKQLTPLMGCHDKDEICLRSCELIARLLDVEACSLLLAGPARQTLRLAAATHIAREIWPQVELSASDGACAEVFQSGRAMLARGVAQFKKHFGRAPNGGRYHTPSCVIVPLQVQGRIEGVINVTNPVGRRAFRQPDVDLLESAAGLIGGALASALQYFETCQIHKNLEDIFDSLHVGILSVNSEGRVANSNERARLLFGLAAPNSASHTLSDVLPVTLFNICRGLMRQACRQQEPVQDRVRIESPASGKEVLLSVTVSRMRCMGGVYSDTLIMFDDVSQDEEVKRLREAESMKRNFLSIISHELRTPLAVIRGTLPLIDPSQGREIEGETLRQVQGLLQRNCHRLSEVVNSILDVTEIESGTLRLVKRPTNLHAMLDDVITKFAEAAGNKQLTWDCRFGIEHPEINADCRRLRQVFSEMVGNAIKFSNPGGRISIFTRERGPWLEIEFTNTGARIEPELRKNVFEKFFQGNATSTRTAGGCGLGLFLVQNIIRLHGGHVELLDREDDGTTFVVRLTPEPVLAAPAASQ